MIGISKPDSWTITAAIRNLTNRRVGVIGFDPAGLCGCNQISYSRRGSTRSALTMSSKADADS